MVNSRETLEKLEGELGKELLEEAKSLLEEAGISIPPDLTLDEALRLLAGYHFKGVFNYDYGDTVNPPDSLGGVRPLATLCGITDAASGQVETYIDTVIIGPGNLPGWLNSPAKDDLLHITEDLVAKSPGLQWHWDKYERVFDVPQGDERTLKIDAVYVYANVRYPKVGKVPSAIFSVIYYMGVFYETETELRKLRAKLQEDAYTDAKKMTGSDIHSTPELKDALRQYAHSKFLEVFKFNYTDPTPPEFEGGAAATFVHNDALKYIQDDVGNNSKLEDFVDKDYFGGVDVRDDRIKDRARQDILTMLVSRPGTWYSTHLTNTYTPSSTSLNPIKAYYVTCYFVEESTTKKNEKASVTYIYILGLFYEVLPTVVVLQKSLYELLCERLNITQGDQWKLKNALFQSAKQQFRSQFFTEWDGRNTKIDIDDVMELRIPYSIVVDFKEYPLTKEAIEERISLGAFRKDGYEFPWDKGLQGRVFEDLVDTITHLSNEFADGRNLNIWKALSRQGQSFRIYASDPRSPTLEQYTTFMYTLGQRAAGQTIVKRFILYYLTVFYALPYDEPVGP